MTRPIDAAAEAGPIARLANNIKELHRSPDAGTIQGAPETFGLNPPAATVRLFGNEPEKLLATLEVGKSIAVGTGKEAQESAHDRRYVRPVEPDGTKGGIEVTDGKLLAAVDSDTYAWREKMLFDVPTFSITDLSVTGPDRNLEAGRGVDGHWTLRKPFASRRTRTISKARSPSWCRSRSSKERGFAVTTSPTATLPGKGRQAEARRSLRSSLEKEKPLVLLVGNPVPDKPDLYYAGKRGDQNDVVWIDGKELATWDRPGRTAQQEGRRVRAVAGLLRGDPGVRSGFPGGADLSRLGPHQPDRENGRRGQRPESLASG